MNSIARIICFLALPALLMGACSSIDCPLNNRVLTNYSLIAADGTADTLKVAMTISTNRIDGADSVLINSDVNVTRFTLPISNTQPRDTFFVRLEGESMSSLDTIVVDKSDMMHFESTDCAASYFHTITGVSTTHNAIDSVAINNKQVDYDTSKTHFRIYFKPRD